MRFWWNRFGPIFAGQIRSKRAYLARFWPQWRWHVDEVFVKINGERHYLWRAVDHEGEVLEAVVTKRPDKRAASKFLRKLMKRYGCPGEIVTDRWTFRRSNSQRRSVTAALARARSGSTEKVGNGDPTEAKRDVIMLRAAPCLLRFGRGSEVRASARSRHCGAVCSHPLRCKLPAGRSSPMR